MTKIIVQHFVENLLKLLKTRKRVRNGLSRIPLRSIRQGAKALSKQRSKTGLQEKKKLLTKNKGVNTIKLETYEVHEQIRKKLNKRGE